MAVPVNGESVFATGTPAPLFQIYGRVPISTSIIFAFDVRNADGGLTDGISDVVVQIFPIPSPGRLFFHPPLRGSSRKQRHSPFGKALAL
jgi:hypothetical protein